MYLHDATLGLINLDQNRIIKVFSIAAVLFLPPTLVGTVYGMNFEAMPELKWASGYPFALGLMIVSAALPYYWFKRKGMAVTLVGERDAVQAHPAGSKSWHDSAAASHGLLAPQRHGNNE